MDERHKMKGQEQMETEKQAQPIVLRCIDFRTNSSTLKWLEEQGLPLGSFYLYASAGASGNSNGFLESISSKHPSSIKAVDHQDCGWYKLNGGDNPEAHHHNLEILGTTIHEQNPQSGYEYYLLPVNDTRHSCSTAAIILGDPDVFEAAVKKLQALGIFDDTDLIARPHQLSPNDKTIWEDQYLANTLHHAHKILIFERDAENAKALVEKASQITKGVEIEPIVVETA